MSNSQTIEIDAAKRVFHLHGENTTGKVVLRKKLAREQLLPFLGNQPASVIAIEAGCGAHHWARAFSRLGHEVRLIHPKFVRPFVKTNKNDWNDAAAICEAAQRPTLPLTTSRLRRLLPEVLEDAENGLVPQQHSSGGKSQLGRISRRGDVYIRRILIQGAHTILRRIDQREGPRAEWLRGLVARRGKKVAAVALANMNARIAWSLLSQESSYEEVRAAA